MSQNINYEDTKAVNYSKGFSLDENRPVILNQDRAAGDVIWSNDFSTAADWTAAGPSTDYNINGWSIGTMTHGWYFGGNNSSDIGTTGEFARFINGDPNTAGDVVEDGPFTLAYNGTIDLTGVPAPHLEFEHYGARFITIQAVEVSTNGGTDWTMVASNDDLVATTANVTNVYPRPDTRRFNIAAAIAADPANVSIRLFWNGAQNGANTNYIEYGWYVDNIRVVEGFSYDTSIDSTSFRSGVNGQVSATGLEYGMVPVTQIAPIEFSSQIVNNGGQVQTGSFLNVVVTDPSNTTTTLVSPSIDLAVSATDVFTTPTFTPTATGTYQIEFTANQTNTDGNATDNVDNASFAVTNNTYSRDNGTVGGGFSNFSNNNNGAVTIGNIMEIFADGVVGAMDVVVTSATTNVGQIVYGRIFLFDANSNSYNEIASTDEYEITSGDLGPNNPIRLYISGGVLNVSAGQDLLVAVAHYGGNPGVVIGSAQQVQQGSVLGYSGSTLTTLTDPEAIMVRLDMRDFASISKENESTLLSVGQNVPNPFSNQATINYNLTESADVYLEVHDVTGKVVATYNEGLRAAGEHNITLSADQLSNGIYFYTFKANDFSVTKQMVVSNK